MHKPTISVIMPVYNGEKFLNEAINSILTQTFTDYELIIINDGSTDNTEKIVLSYDDSRIIYVKNEYNLKLIKTLNKGVELAKGKYIARMDADDISLPIRFEKQVEIFNSYTGIDIVNINSYSLSEEGRYFRRQKSAVTLGFEAIKYLIPLQNFICHPGVVVKSELLKNYKYIDDLSKEHIEDFDLWNRMLKDGCICYTIDECLIYYRNNIASINRTQKDKQVERMYLLCSNLIEEQFNFQFNSNSLKILLGEKVQGGYDILKRFSKEILAYLLLIKNNFPISSFGYREMEQWRKQQIILFSLKLFPNCDFIKKIGILFFLFCHLGWLNDGNLRILLKRMIFTKYKVRHQDMQDCKVI